jgi:dipeptidyl aminopeptidase/acylaminoacyl peptidase
MDAALLQAIARSARLAGMQLSPDGQRVALLRTEDGRTELYVAAADGASAVRRLTTQGVPRPEHGDAGPAWSPDGTHVVTLSPASAGGVDVAVVEVATGVTRTLTDGHRSCAAPRWSPDGRWIAFLVTSPPRPRTLESPPPSWDVAVDEADPRHLSGAYGLVALWLSSADGGTIMRVAVPEASFLDFDWRRDARGLVAAAIEPRTATGLMLAIDIDGDEPCTVRPLASADGQQYRAPRIAPDGRLAYLSDRSGFFEVILRACAEAHADERSLTADGRDKTELAWTSDGRLCVADSDQGFVRLVVLDPQEGGDAPRWLATDGVASSISAAADRARVAFLLESPSQPPQARVSDLDGGTDRVLADASVVGLVERLATAFERRRYPGSDGLEIEGFLGLPETPGSVPPPLVVYAHGGPTAAHVRGWQPFLNWLTKQGYAVFAPNFRGSTHYGRAFERANDHDWGGGDLDDVVRCVDFLGQAGVIDPRRAAIFGGSYGGYLTLLALTKRPEVFRCGVSLYAVSNRHSSWLTTDRLGRHNMEKEMGPMATRREAYRDASPLYALARIRAPLLILHGEDDARVPFAQSLELVDGLKRAGVFHVFASYPGEGHGFQRPEHVADAHARVTTFLRNFL